MKRFVVWGCTGNLDSFRHINRAYVQAAHKMGISAKLLPDEPGSNDELTPGTVVFCADVCGKYIANRPGVDYVLHNFSSDHPVFVGLESERLLRLQVWTNDSWGEEWGMFRHYNREARLLFQPWGTDLLAEEFMLPVFNAHAREVVHVGAVWGEANPVQGEMGNKAAIEELRLAVADYGLALVHRTHISDMDNILAVRDARLAPAVAGEWQATKNYLPCRAFKNPSYGALSVCNVPGIKQLFGDAAVPGDTITELVQNALAYRKDEYLDRTRQQQLAIAQYSYRESLLAIDRALEEGR